MDFEKRVRAEAAVATTVVLLATAAISIINYLSITAPSAPLTFFTITVDLMFPILLIIWWLEIFGYKLCALDKAAIKKLEGK